MPIIGESTAHSQTIFANDLGFVIIAFLKHTLNRANTTYLLFQFFLGVAVRLVNWFGCFSKVMKVAALMRDFWQSRGDRVANGVLP